MKMILLFIGRIYNFEILYGFPFIIITYERSRSQSMNNSMKIFEKFVIKINLRSISEKRDNQL